MIAKIQAVIPVLDSIEILQPLPANALPMKVNIENKYLKMVFAKNKTANEQLQEVLK